MFHNKLIFFLAENSVGFRAKSIHDYRRSYIVNFNGFSLNLVCASILRRSGLGLFMVKFCQFLTVIFLRHVHIHTFFRFSTIM